MLEPMVRVGYVPLRRVALVLLAVSSTLGACKKPEARSTTTTAGTRVHVETQLVEDRTAPTVLTLTGVLDAQERTDLAANVVGRIVRTFVERGQRVAMGAPIAQVDTRMTALTFAEAAANARSATEQLTLARADCARDEELFKKGVITKQEYDKVATQCLTQASSEEAARMRAAEATQTISDANIRAPFAGVIAERFAHVGDYVRADTKVVTLLVDDPLRLRLTVPERSIPFAKEGVEVSFEIAALPERTFKGTIRFVGREVRSLSRDLVVEAVVDNHDEALFPGMFVTAHLPTGEAVVPVIPRHAMVPLDANQSVFVVVDGRLQQRVVQVGASLGDAVAILDGLKKGERIVTDPSQAADGQLVE
jgi:RND family efflux transporter MFP subunit